jgi:DNA-binding NarL/FixJ family response regulator
MTRPPRRSVLHKIAARRNRVKGAATPAAWTTFLSGSAPVPQPHRPAPVHSRPLTQRELEVLHLVARGETDQGIADQLYLSRRTINCHVANILAKLDVPSRTAAAMTAMRIGLL